MPYVLYNFQTNGTRAGPATFLNGYDKFVQCDANTVNCGLFVPSKDAPATLAATEVGCWSHARRGFFDAKDLWPATKEVLDMIGRKNWMFYGSEAGDRTGAIWHSFMGSAIRHGLNEYEYILDVLDRLSDLPSQAEMFELLPDRWKPRNSR